MNKQVIRKSGVDSFIFCIIGTVDCKITTIIIPCQATIRMVAGYSII